MTHNIVKEEIKPRCGTSLIMTIIIMLCAIVTARLVMRSRTDLEKYERHTGILIVGPISLKQSVCEALVLLETEAPTKFLLVTQYVSIIISNNPDGTDVRVNPPVVGFSRTMDASVFWRASALVHEAVHIRKLRMNQRLHGGGFVFKEVAGSEAETEAGQMAAETLRELRAPDYMLTAAESDRGEFFTELGTQQLGRDEFSYWMQTDQIVHSIPLQRARPELAQRLQTFLDSTLGVKSSELRLISDSLLTRALRKESRSAAPRQ